MDILDYPNPSPADECLDVYNMNEPGWQPGGGGHGHTKVVNMHVAKIIANSHNKLGFYLVYNLQQLARNLFLSALIILYPDVPQSPLLL